MTLKILVAGATGKTGIKVTEELLAAGHEPVALVRESSDTGKLPAGVATRLGDLTDLNDNVCVGIDAAVFAAGSGGSTDQEMTDKVDRDGAKRLIDNAKQCGVKRFVMLSSIGADQSDPEGELAHYLKAKHAADEYLKRSGVTYAILRPVALTDDGKSGNITLGDAVDPKAEASRADVAEVLAKAAHSGNLDGQVLNMQSALRHCAVAAAR